MTSILYALKKLQKLVWACLLGGIALSACHDNDVFKGTDPDSETPNLFDFSTKNQIDLTVSYQVPQNYRVNFEAYYTNPISVNDAGDYIKDPAAIPFLTGCTDENGKFNFSLEMPSYVENIYVYSENFGVPTLLQGTVEGNKANISKVGNTRSKTVTRTATNNYSKWQQQNYRCQNPTLSQESTTIDDELMKIIDNTLPKDKDLVSSFYYEKLTLKEEAEIFLYFVSNGSSQRQNALAYYVIPEGKTWEQATVNNNLILAFPDLKSTQKGEGVKLLHYLNGTPSSIFPAGSTIAFALLVDARQNDGLSNPAHILYSEKEYNSYTVHYNSESTIAWNRPHMGAFKAGSNIILAFEDQPYHEGYLPGDFRDEVFIVKATPPTSLPDDVEQGTEDPNKDPEFDNQTIVQSGILAFEDNWPQKGDYDLNDVMVSYTRTLNWRNKDFKVVSIDEVYTFLHDGAVFNNSFGYELGAQMKKDGIKSVTITSAYSCKGQGLDPDLENATIMLFDNGKKVPVGTTFKVHTVFNSPTDYISFNIYPYNPFIVSNGYTTDEDNYLQYNRTEVHLPQKYAPTPKANVSLFGTGDDKSKGNKYYIRSGNYPFALDLSLKIYDSAELPEFGVPIEKQPIDVTYPAFKTWVESNGNQAKDWYIKK